MHVLPNRNKPKPILRIVYASVLNAFVLKVFVHIQLLQRGRGESGPPLALQSLYLIVLFTIWTVSELCLWSCFQHVRNISVTSRTRSRFFHEATIGMLTASRTSTREGRPESGCEGFGSSSRG